MKKIGKFILGILLIFVCAGSVLVYMGYKEYQNALAVQGLTDKIDEIQSQENYVSLEQLPPVYLDAVVAVEDHDFYHHSGIDMEAIGRARGMLVSGGEVNTERAAIMLVDEFRASKWGRITLETPPRREEQNGNEQPSV